MDRQLKIARTAGVRIENPSKEIRDVVIDTEVFDLRARPNEVMTRRDEPVMSPASMSKQRLEQEAEAGVRRRRGSDGDRQVIRSGITRDSRDGLVHDPDALTGNAGQWNRRRDGSR